ncbi:MAG: hypothetical protein BWZ10_01300 [candidate division BRC1 bacterium ADurb.BinA364]|nr:MAG: hypothetical protein BWZ10_01300 [candidate division BRC1 bacterium ADurb.BinA364]
MPDVHAGSLQRRAQDVFQLCVRAVRAGPAGAVAVGLQLPDLPFQLLGLRCRHLVNEGRGVRRVQVNALGGRQDDQRAGVHQVGDDGGRLVVVHALVRFLAAIAQVGKLHLAVFLAADRVVIVHDRHRPLLRGPKEQAADVLALFRVVKVLVLHQHLPKAVFRPQKLAVAGHQDGLALRGVIGLGVLARGQFPARALEMVEPSDFRRAGGHEHHARPKLRGDAGKRVVVDIQILRPNQGHGANFSHQVNVAMHQSFTPLQFSRVLYHRVCIRARNVVYFILEICRLKGKQPCADASISTRRPPIPSSSMGCRSPRCWRSPFWCCSRTSSSKACCLSTSSSPWPPCWSSGARWWTSSRR